VAHFRFSPGSHGGTVTPFDDSAAELVDPNFHRPPLRAVAPVPAAIAAEAEPELPLEVPVPAPAQPEPQEQPAKPARARRRKPEVPAWEDVLLGVRSGTQP
jgi:hypothetical protein